MVTAVCLESEELSLDGCQPLIVINTLLECSWAMAVIIIVHQWYGNSVLAAGLLEGNYESSWLMEKYYAVPTTKNTHTQYHEQSRKGVAYLQHIQSVSVSLMFWTGCNPW